MSSAAFAEPVGRPEAREPINGRIMDTNDLDNVVKALLMGLITPGEQWKQGALEKALRALCSDDWVEKARVEFKWPAGRDDI